MKKIVFLFGLLFSFQCIFSQEITIKEFIVIDGDTIIISKVPEVEVLAFKNREEKLRYYILKRKVLKVYP